MDRRARSAVVRGAAAAQGTRADALAQLAEIARTAPELDAAMAEATRVVVAVLGVDIAAVFERLPRGDCFVRRASTGLRQRTADNLFLWPEDAGLTDLTARSTEPVVVPDLDAETRFACPPILREERVASALGVALRVPGQGEAVLGTLNALSRSRRAFTPDDAAFVRGVADVLGAAIGRRCAEERRREQGGRFGLLAASTKLGALLPLDPDGTLLDWSAPAERVHGYREEEILGRRFSGLFPVEDVARGVPDAMLHAARLAGETEGEAWLVRRDGARFLARVTLIALRDEAGALRGFAARTREIASPAGAGALLAEEGRSLLQTVIDQLPAGVVVHEAGSGQIIMQNDQVWAAARLRVGSVLPVARHPDGRPFADDEHAAVRALRGEKVRQEMLTERGDGTTATLVERGAPVRDREGNIIAGVAVVVDVTTQKAAEREQERLLDETRRAVRARDEILAVVSHDLRSPLGAIMIAAGQVLRKGPDADRGRTEEHLRRILRAAEGMDRLISDLLDVSRLEAGRLVLDLGDHRAADLVADAVDLFAPLATEKGVRLRARGNPDCADVRCDRDRILQVLGNLIGNALKVVPPKRRVVVGCHVADEQIVFFVRDEGPGIRAEDLPHLFDRYWQARGTDAKRGLGLGLAIAKGIVEAHRGRIWAESDLGHGATFFFSLPLAAGTAGPSALNNR